jgi:hypothetical protein
MDILLSNVSWFTPTWDLFVILFLIVAAFLLGLTLGKNKIIILLISIYIAAVVINFFPFGDIFETPKTDENFVYPIAIFIVVVFVFYILLSNSALNKALRKTGGRSVFLIALFSLFCVGLVLSVVLSFFPKDLVETFNPITQKLFMAKFSRFLWALAPVVGMTIHRGRRGKTRGYKHNGDY